MTRLLFHRLLPVALLVFGLALPAAPQSGIYTDARALVGRVQEDLRHAEGLAHLSGKESDRYRNAQHHLSDFDGSLSKGKFDKGKLDQAIDDVKNFVEHNTLAPEDRDALTADLSSLRDLRYRRGNI